MLELPHPLPGEKGGEVHVGMYPDEAPVLSERIERDEGREGLCCVYGFVPRLTL